MMDFILLITGILMIAAGSAIAILNSNILRARRIWTEDNEPSVRMSFDMFLYLYNIVPANFYLRDYSVHIDILSHQENVTGIFDKTYRLQYREYCPIIFNQFDTVRYALWNKYKRPKEDFSLEKSIKYTKVLSSLIPQFVTLSKFKTSE